MNGAEQFGRKCSLIVADRGDEGLDLSQLRIKFVVKRSDVMTPNVADIRVYNVEKNTAERIQKEFSRVKLEAGYEGNYGVIFQGNIKQVILGRESATDTFIDIVAGDGDRAFNFAVVNKTIAAGAKLNDQVNAAIDSMSTRGVSAGHLGEFPETQLPRGKVMYGNARNYLRDVASTSEKAWSIQDEQVTFVGLKTYLPGEAVVLTSDTGMIGTPQQTTWGVNVKCLLNPLIKTGGRIKIDNASVEKYKLNIEVKQSAANYPAPLTADGIYYVSLVEYQGDTRGVDWYASIVGLIVDQTSNPLNSVQNQNG